MIPDKSTKEGIIHQLKYLSKRYEELLNRFDELEKPTQQQKAKKPKWTVFLNKYLKKRASNIDKS